MSNPVKSRHRAREIALQVLYRYDVAQHGENPVQFNNPNDLLSDLNRHFDHFTVPESLREFAAQLVAGTLTEMEKLDQILEKHTSNWKVSRMGFVDRSLLRMATYEMLHFPEISPTVVIDEAIELGKQFGTAETPSFINGILDAIRADIPNTAVST